MLLGFLATFLYLVTIFIRSWYTEVRKTLEFKHIPRKKYQGKLFSNSHKKNLPKSYKVTFKKYLDHLTRVFVLVKLKQALAIF